MDLCIDLINPKHGLPKLKETPEKPIIPNIDEFRVLLDELPPTIRYMALFGVHTGIKPRNIIQLQWDQLDMDGEYLIIDSYKGSNNRNAPPLILKLHSELLELIGMFEKTRIPGEIYMFPKSYKQPHKNFMASWHRTCKKAKIPEFKFKNLRATYISWRIKEGVSIGSLQRALGHTTVNTTARFYNLAQKCSNEIVKTQRSLMKLVTPDRDNEQEKKVG